MAKIIHKYWEKLVTLGISPTDDRKDIKKNRLVNSLGVIGVLGYVPWIVIYVFDGIGITALEAAAAMVIMSIVLLINYQGWFSLGRYYHYFSTIVCLMYFGIAHGAKDGAEYLLFITCVMGLFYFTNRALLAFLFLFNLACFWIVKYTHTIMEPPVQSGHALYVGNLVSAFLVLFCIAYYFKLENAMQEQLLEDQNDILEIEKGKSERLLTNILPVKVAEEIKNTGAAIPQLFQMATVIFTDFKGFTKVAQTMSPVELVEIINEYFTAFDKIILNYNIEKIKTIGDAYLCVGGIPTANGSNPIDAVMAAIEFQKFIKEKKRLASEQNKISFDMRIGIHTGSVIAGVVGTSKYAYDIWGDTVNIASRLETLCDVGKINISQFTYDKIKDKCDVENRGKIKVKSLGMIDMYYVNSASY